MYFGSVRFFKQLIVTIVIILIAVPTATSIRLYRQIDENKKYVQDLQNNNTALAAFASHYKGEHLLSYSDVYLILQDLQIENSDMINLIYEKDRNAFENVLNVAVFGQGRNEDEPDLRVGGEPEPDNVLDEPLKSKPYMNLYPALYTDVMLDGDYIDDDNYIYLTFDDGPSYNTEDILRYLDKYDIPATFFVIPSDTESSKRYLNQMLESGHSIGVHTFSHDYKKIYADVKAFLDDFNKAYELIYEQTGYKPFLYRFPGGSRNDFNKETYKDIVEEMTRRGFVYFDWNVDSEDALGANWTKMYTGVQEQVKNQSTAIVLFHDGPANRNTVLVMDDILKVLKENPKNYTFSAITEKTRPRHF